MLATTERQKGSNWLLSNGIELSPLGLKVADILGEVYQGINRVDPAIFDHPRKWEDDYCIEVFPTGTLLFSRNQQLMRLCDRMEVCVDIIGASNGYRLKFFHKSNY